MAGVDIFLTGASGFVGGRLARQLSAAGHHVRALVRRLDRSADLAALGVELFAGDVSAKETMRAPMTGADAVLHVAGWYKIGSRDRNAAVATNVTGTQNVLELMRDLGVPRGVYTSTLAVNSDTHGRVVDETYRFYGRHTSLYDETKAKAHALAENFIAAGLPLVIVQPGLVYGPGDNSSVRRTLIDYLTRRLPLIPKATAFSWGHVDDVARGHVLAIERGQPGRSYFLAGPSHTLEEALLMAQEITGIPPPKLRAPPSLLRGVAAIAGVLEKVMPLPASYTAEGLRVVAGVTYIGSNERARTELGWTVRPLREGLEETLRHELALLGSGSVPRA